MKASSPLRAPFKPPSSPLEAPGGLKGASRGLQGGLKGAWSLPKVKGASRGLKGAWRGLQGGFKGAWRGLHLRKASRSLEGGFKGAWRGEGEAPFKPPSSPLQAPLKPPWSPLEAPLKPSEGEAPFDLQTFVPPPPPPRPQTLQAKGVPRNQPQLATPRARMSTVQINKLNQRRRWQKSVGSKSVQGEDRKEQVANRELCRWQRNQKVVNRGEPVARDP